jgi:hypothetical protein
LARRTLPTGAIACTPVEWNIGEAAGALAAFALEERVPPAAVREYSLERLQRRLQDEGVPIDWPSALS